MIKVHSIQRRWIYIYLLKTEIQRLLLTSVGFGFLLLLARTVYTGGITFFFLVWNLFLAFIPYFLSYTLTLRPAWAKNKWKFSLALVTWLLFVPNSFYMLTDLFHLYDSASVPRWYDLLLIFCFAWNALLMGILSVRHIEKIIQSRWHYRTDWLFVYPVMLLNALGIYIGRYLRFNSWDVVSNPFHLVADIVRLVIHPIAYKDAWAMVCCFSFFLSILYMTLRKLSRPM
ncbi:MAG: DUF1361 domain-containing protein [Chitinophagaceae bacterium]